MALTWSEYVDLVHPKDSMESQRAKQIPIGHTLSPEFNDFFDAKLADYIKRNGIDYSTLHSAPQERVYIEFPHKNVVQFMSDMARSGYDSPKPIVRTTPEQVDAIISDMPNLTPPGRKQAAVFAFNSTGFDPNRHLEKLAGISSDLYRIAPNEDQLFGIISNGGFLLHPFNARLNEMLKDPNVRAKYIKHAIDSTYNSFNDEVFNNLLRRFPDMTREESKYILDKIDTQRFNSGDSFFRDAALSRDGISPSEEFLKEYLSRPDSYDAFHGLKGTSTIYPNGIAHIKKIINESQEHREDQKRHMIAALANRGYGGLSALNGLNPSIVEKAIDKSFLASNSFRYLASKSKNTSPEILDAISNVVRSKNDPMFSHSWFIDGNNDGDIKPTADDLITIGQGPRGHGSTKYKHISHLSPEDMEKVLTSTNNAGDLDHTVAVWLKENPGQKLSSTATRRTGVKYVAPDNVARLHFEHALEMAHQGKQAKISPEDVAEALKTPKAIANPNAAPRDTGADLTATLRLPNLDENTLATIASSKGKDFKFKDRAYNWKKRDWSALGVLNIMADPKNPSNNVFNGRNGTELRVKIGSSALRNLRDHLDEQAEKGVASIRPEDLPSGKKWTTTTREITDKKGNVQHVLDWNPLRDPKMGGNLTADRVRAYIDMMPESKLVAVDAGKWSAGEQNHSDTPTNITVFHIHPETIERLRSQGLLGAWTAIAGLQHGGTGLRENRGPFDLEHPGNFVHPHTPYTIGWMRHSQNKKTKQIFIDEIQSDTLSNFREIMQSSKVPDDAKQRAQSAMDIVFGKVHPSEMLLEAAHQMFRDRGHIGHTISMHTPKSKALISLERKNDPVPAHFRTTYDEVPKRMGHTPSTYGTKGVEKPRDEYKDLVGQPTHETKLRKNELDILAFIGDL